MAADATTTLKTTTAVPEKITNAQTVCNRRNEKNKLCNGHIKQLGTGGEDARKHLRGDDVLFKCQSCGTLYMGPPLGHVRDVDKQQRFVEKELAALLKAAGGSLPAIRKNEKGVYVLVEAAPQHAPAAAKPAATAAAKPAAAAKPSAPATAHVKSPSETSLGPIPGASGPVPGETPEQKLARLKAVAAEAKRRKALLEADAEGGATAPAAAAPPQPAAQQAQAPPAAAATHAPSAASLGPIPGASGPVPGETPEQKLARLKAVVAEAKRRKALLEGDEAAGAAGATQDAARTTPTAASTSGTDSSAEADAHRPAAEAQAATGMASAAPLSPAAATASPVAGPETPADLAPDTVSPATQAGASANDLGPIPGASGPVPGETREEKIARLQAVVAEAKRRKALLGGE
ncbi:MAG TPA: hypothetical protein VF658_14125 [Pyrinomonadaceae bacterium]|jgi:hypothetical protein